VGMLWRGFGGAGEYRDWDTGGGGAVWLWARVGGAGECLAATAGTGTFPEGREA
jgi:hypothetical protein